jgi:hypothetical protein
VPHVGQESAPEVSHKPHDLHFLSIRSGPTLFSSLKNYQSDNQEQPND